VRSGRRSLQEVKYFLKENADRISAICWSIVFCLIFISFESKESFLKWMAHSSFFVSAVSAIMFLNYKRLFIIFASVFLFSLYFLIMIGSYLYITQVIILLAFVATIRIILAFRAR
jgi:hypothetical protein